MRAIRLIIPVVLCLGWLNLFCQQENAMPGKDQPSETLLLRQGWKWMKGDEPAWSSPGFDDANWPSVGPADLEMDRDRHILTDSVIWFRNQFVIPGNASLSLAFGIEQSGASQIFVDGKLVQQYGIFNKSWDKAWAFNPLNDPCALALSPGKHSVAVRFVFQQAPGYYSSFYTSHPVFRMTLGTSSAVAAVAGETRKEPGNYFRAGLFLAFMILFSTSSLFGNSRSTRIYLALWALTNLVQHLVLIHLGDLHYTYQRSNISLLATLIHVLQFPLLYMAVRQSISCRTKWAGWTMVALVSLSIIANLYGYLQSANVMVVTFMATVLMPLVLLAMAFNVRHENPRAFRLLFAAVLLSMAGLVFLSYSSLPTGLSQMAGAASYQLGILLVPVSLVLPLIAGSQQSILKGSSEEDRMDEAEDMIRQLKENNRLLQEREREKSDELSRVRDELRRLRTAPNSTQPAATNIPDVTPVHAEEGDDGNRKSAVAGHAEQGVDVKARKLLLNRATERSQDNSAGLAALTMAESILSQPDANGEEQTKVSVNKLLEEYMILALNATRAKDRNFACELDLQLDPKEPTALVQEQDLARVLVYVFMQAFNDLLEKAKTLPSGYSPKLTIASAMKQGKVEMVIEDNGLGSTRKPREKTDVGERSTVFDLTACYQLVHRNHRGRMKVDSRPGAYTTVYISLPSESMATTLQG